MRRVRHDEGMRSDQQPFDDAASLRMNLSSSGRSSFLFDI